MTALAYVAAGATLYAFVVVIGGYVSGWGRLLWAAVTVAALAVTLLALHHGGKSLDDPCRGSVGDPSAWCPGDL